MLNSDPSVGQSVAINRPDLFLLHHSSQTTTLIRNKTTQPEPNPTTTTNGMLLYTGRVLIDTSTSSVPLHVIEVNKDDFTKEDQASFIQIVEVPPSGFVNFTNCLLINKPSPSTSACCYVVFMAKAQSSPSSHPQHPTIHIPIEIPLPPISIKKKQSSPANSDDNATFFRPKPKRQHKASTRSIPQSSHQPPTVEPTVEPSVPFVSLSSPPKKRRGTTIRERTEELFQKNVLAEKYKRGVDRFFNLGLVGEKEGGRWSLLGTLSSALSTSTKQGPVDRKIPAVRPPPPSTPPSVRGVSPNRSRMATPERFPDEGWTSPTKGRRPATTPKKVAKAPSAVKSKELKPPPPPPADEKPLLVVPVVEEVVEEEDALNLSVDDYFELGMK
jgi:hypothetical protein